MNRYRIIYAPEAEADLRELHAYIATQATRHAATAYLRRLEAFCKSLCFAPHRGEQRTHRSGQRSIGFEDRVRIVFAVFDEEQLVEVQGFDYGGRQRW